MPAFAAYGPEDPAEPVCELEGCSGGRLRRRLRAPLLEGPTLAAGLVELALDGGQRVERLLRLGALRLRLFGAGREGIEQRLLAIVRKARPLGFKILGERGRDGFPYDFPDQRRRNDRNMIADRLFEYIDTRDLYQMPGVSKTVNMDHIKYHYFGSHRVINPTGIIPKGPEIDFSAPHRREELNK